MKWFELAKVGEYRDRFGKLVKLTRDRLAKCAEQYKPDVYQAPITVGHPDSAKEPAWGKVGALKFENDTLFFSHPDWLQNLPNLLTRDYIPRFLLVLILRTGL
jgi:hypothetical protein